MQRVHNITLVLGLLPAFVAGCASPFDVQDVNLSTPRFVSVAADSGLEVGKESHLSALFYRGDSFYPMEQTLSLSWILPLDGEVETLKNLTELDPETLKNTTGLVFLGEGPDLSWAPTESQLPAGSDPIVIGVAAYGQVLGEAVETLAFLSLSRRDDASGILDLSIPVLSRVPGLDLPEPGAVLSSSALGFEAREGMATTESKPFIEPGQALRVTLPSISDYSDPVDVIWRSVAGLGTLLPLSNGAVDVLPGTLSPVEEDEKKLTAVAIPEGWLTLLGTAQTELGIGSVVVVDVQIKPESASKAPSHLSNPMALGQGGRVVWVDVRNDEARDLLMAADGPIFVAGTFKADGQSKGGFVWMDVAPATVEAGPDPYGVAALNCLYPPASERPLSLLDFAYGRCVVEDVLEKSVIMQVDVLLPTEVQP